MKFLDIDPQAIRTKSIVAVILMVVSWTIIGILLYAQAVGVGGIGFSIISMLGFIVWIIAYASPIFVFIYGVTLAIANRTPETLAYGIISAGLVAIAAGIFIAFQLGLL